MIQNKYTLEIAAFDYNSAMKAVRAGADRIEICSNHHEGGTTPSYGTLRQLADDLAVPVFAMLRVRGGDFLYNENELAVMRSDLLCIKELGYQGVVFGFLTKDGSVDKAITSRFVEYAYPMDVTFHRAFDRTNDAYQALEDVIDCGCQRILTSGRAGKAIDALPQLKELVRQADDRISIMPGSGVRSDNLKTLRIESRANEFHSAAGLQLPSSMEYINLNMQEETSTSSIDEVEVRLMKQILLNTTVAL